MLTNFFRGNKWGLRPFFDACVNVFLVCCWLTSVGYTYIYYYPFRDFPEELGKTSPSSDGNPREVFYFLRLLLTLFSIRDYNVCLHMYVNRVITCTFTIHIIKLQSKDLLVVQLWLSFSRTYPRPHSQTPWGPSGMHTCSQPPLFISHLSVKRKKIQESY